MLQLLIIKCLIARALAELCCAFLILFCCVKMVLIDRGSRELSNGCHIVDFDYLNPNGEHLAAAVDFQLSAAFLPRF